MANDWRKKTLPLAEWSALQTHFAQFQMATGAPANLAMFIKAKPDDPASEIYLVGPGVNIIEAYSPGGWENSEAPTGDGVSLLVGEGDPWVLFGIDKPV